MSLRFAILNSLAQRPASGYDLLRRFDHKYNLVWWASHGSIYTELQRLEQEGLSVPRDGGSRNRQEHSVTAKGIEAIRAWLRTAPARRPRDELVLRVWSLWLLPPSEAATFFDDLAAMYRERLADYEGRSQTVTTDTDDPAGFYDAIALEAGIAHERASLAWAEESARKIRERQPGVRVASPEQVASGVD